MNKQLIIIAAAGILAAMTGCGKDTVSTATVTSTVAGSQTASTTSATKTTSNTTDAVSETSSTAQTLPSEVAFSDSYTQAEAVSEQSVVTVQPTEENAILESDSCEDPFDEYIGQWESSTQWNGTNFNIQISRDCEIINVEITAHSSVADYLWDYSCICSEDGTFIECTGGGTMLRTDYAPDGNIQGPVIVYTDGTARFNIKGGTLFWSDSKDGTAAQVGFSKIG